MIDPKLFAICFVCFVLLFGAISTLNDFLRNRREQKQVEQVAYESWHFMDDTQWGCQSEENFTLTVLQLNERQFKKLTEFYRDEFKTEFLQDVAINLEFKFLKQICDKFNIELNDLQKQN